MRGRDAKRLERRDVDRIAKKGGSAHQSDVLEGSASARRGEIGFESVDGVELTREIFLRRINRQRRFIFEMLGIPCDETCNVGSLFCQI